jgi:hypothetical protein
LLGQWGVYRDNARMLGRAQMRHVVENMRLTTPLKKGA